MDYENSGKFFPLRDKNMYPPFELCQDCFICNGDYMSNLQAEVCNFSKRNTPPWVFFTFKIVQLVPNRAKHHILVRLNVR